MNKFSFRGFLRFINIKDDSHKEFAIENLSKGIFIKGANLWYLITSAIIASIGLDTNSPAVIIGAMLISPLMSPILGIGLSVGIYDKGLLFASLKEFLVAVLLSLIISTLYFLLSPLGHTTNELLSRTTPTLLDIGIAFFGGVAGIVAGTRKGIVNSIPGVAIATALMPPICTAGYGIATGNPGFFFGAFYLFFINAVFISFSAVLIVRYLKFPIKKYLDIKTKARIRRVIYVIIVIVSVPSLIIFYKLIKNANEQRLIKIFISQNFDEKNRSVLSWKLQQFDTSRTLKVLYLGEKYRSGESDSLRNLLRTEFGNIDLKVQQMDQGYKIENLERRLGTDVEEKFQALFDSKSEMEERLKKIEESKTFNEKDSLKLAKMKTELGIMFPSYKDMEISRDSLMRININTGLRKRDLYQERKRIKDFLKLRVNDTTAVITVN